MSHLLSVAVVASALLAQTDATPSNHEQLQEYADAFLGTWTGEWVWDADIPGVIKKGDKVFVKAVSDWSLDEQAIDTGWEAKINGKYAGRGKGMVGWDRSTKEIVQFGFGTFGGRNQGTVQKVGDAWLVATLNVTSSGQKRGNTVRIRFEDEGDTQVHELIGRMTEDGKPLPDMTIRYHRVKE